MRILVVFLLFSSTAFANDFFCKLHVRRVNGAAFASNEWTSMHYEITSNQAVADKDSIPVMVRDAGPGALVLIQSSTGFELYYNTPWANSLLHLDLPSYKRAFGGDRPTCDSIQNLEAQARPLVELSHAALGALRAPTPGPLSWSHFFLSAEATMYFQDGFWVNLESLLKVEDQRMAQLRVIDQSAPKDFLKRLDLITKTIFNTWNFANACAKSNALTGTILTACTACQGQTLAVISALKDLHLVIPPPYQLGVQFYSDHVRPVLWDGQQHRYMDLVYAGAWETVVDGPIFRPEYLIDRLLQTGYSGLAPNEKAVMTPDAFNRYLIADIPAPSKPAPTLLARMSAWLHPVPVAPNPQGLAPKGDLEWGLMRDISPGAPNEWPNGSANKISHLTRKDFGVGSPAVGKVSELLMSSEELNFAKKFVNDLTLNSDDTGFSLKLLNARYSGRFDSVTDAIEFRRRFSIEPFVRAIGAERQLRFQRKLLVPSFGLETFKLSPAQQAEWPKLSILERNIMIDQVVSQAGMSIYNSPGYADLRKYLRQPPKEQWNPSAQEFRARRQVLQSLLDFQSLSKIWVVLYSYDIQRPQNVKFAEQSTTYALPMSAEWRDLLGDVAHHGLALGENSRTILERMSHWDNDQISAFNLMYTDLGSLAKENPLNAKVVRWYWPGEAQPEILTNLLMFPLQPLFAKMLFDPDFQYAPPRTAEDLARLDSIFRGHPSFKSWQPKVEIDLPTWKGFSCANRDGGTYRLSSGVAVECPRKPETTGSVGSQVMVRRQEKTLPAELVYVLLNSQPPEYLTWPPAQLMEGLLFSASLGDLRTLADRANMDRISQFIFRKSAFLIPHKGGHYSKLDLSDFKPCDLDNFKCLNERVAKAQLAGDRPWSKPWFQSDPLQQTGYLAWNDWVARLGLPDELDPQENTTQRVVFIPDGDSSIFLSSELWRVFFQFGWLGLYQGAHHAFEMTRVGSEILVFGANTDEAYFRPMSDDSPAALLRPKSGTDLAN